MDSNSVQNGAKEENATARYAPGSVEDRLLKLDAETAKKAFHQSRTLKRVGVLCIATGILFLLLVLSFLVFPRLIPGGSGQFVKTMRNKAILMAPMIVLFPAFGVTLRYYRTTAAKWLIRIVSIVMVAGGIFSMVVEARESNVGAFIGDLISVLISLRLCVITYNELLFGPNAPSHHQLGYVHTKWKSHHTPEHIPEHVHKPPKFAKACFFLSFLMIPVVLLRGLDDFSNMQMSSKSQEYFERGKKAFDEAARAEKVQEAVDKYGKAYFYFSLAASDKANEDVHVYLGICYARGLGAPRNDAEAFHQLSMYPAVTNEYPDAQYQLGILYLYGRGTDPDVAQAAKLLQAAAERGQKDARELLGYPEIDPDSPLAADDAPDYGGLTVEEYLVRKVAESEGL